MPTYLQWKPVQKASSHSVPYFQGVVADSLVSYSQRASFGPFWHRGIQARPLGLAERYPAVPLALSLTKQARKLQQTDSHGSGQFGRMSQV